MTHQPNRVLTWLTLGFLAIAISSSLAAAQPALSDRIEGGRLGPWEQVGSNTFAFEIPDDDAASHSRWYSFRVHGMAGEEVTMRITNAGQTNASGAWRFNRPVHSVDDGETWERIARTSYSDGVFEFTFTAETDRDWLALVPVYDYSRWIGLLSQIRSHERVVEIRTIARSLDGNGVRLLRIANDQIPEQQKESVWIIGRQHPAETPSSWMTEGMIGWLLSDDPAAEAMLEHVSFNIIGFTNPDGVIRGFYRTNVAGLNLNRQWSDPDPETAPSIAASIETIVEHRDTYDNLLFIADMHAHSTIRENFFYYNNVESTSEQLYQEMLDFKRAFNEINPDFTASSGRSRGTDRSTAGAWGGREFEGVHSVTFEAAYQDIRYGPDPGYMTVDRYKRLGSTFAQAIGAFFYNIDIQPD